MAAPDRPTTAPPIPRRAEDVTGAWLQTVLGAGGHHAVIEDVAVTPIGTGQTGATFRVTPRYGSGTTTLPATFVLKLPTGDDSIRAGVTLGYLSEVTFYTEVADHTRAPIPRCYHSEITEDGAEFALLLDDLAPAVQGDQIAGCDAEAARLAVTALAGLHGPSWCDPAWLELPVAMPKPGDTAGAGGLGDVARMASDMVLERVGDRMSAEDRETMSAALDLVGPWLLAHTDRYAVMHGDYRLDNLMFDTDRVAVVDWQTVGIGLPARDLAYFTATSLDPEIRAACESDLVDAYHSALLAHGVTDYSRETCWQDYRFGMVQGPLITALGCAFASPTARGEELFLVMLGRSCRAIRELGTLDLIRAAS
ncbi:phosphotransferase family protein [Nocardia bovistercoris]|uniref:Phosphotransferase n=1 Tax=Nocardia bovistercoris TaxID=2785916 RepID=A0A931IE31_9NOCA|nr:phosphotransferase [Nocardia bovistercoris]MBH0778068.1 phosphotransferase [Nocardia bovistercoris]